MTFGWLLILTAIYFQGLQMLELQIKTSIIKYRQGKRMAWRNTKMQTGLQTWIINTAWDSSVESPRTSLTLLLFCPFLCVVYLSSFFFLLFSFFSISCFFDSFVLLCANGGRTKSDERTKTGDRFYLIFRFRFCKASAFITEARAGAGNTIFWLVIKLTGRGITLPSVKPRPRLTLT